MRYALIALAVGLAHPALAVPTEIHVRVLSLGAKFIGTSMGGVEITLRDAETGAVLAKGVTAGSTGDTARIMQGGPRNAQVSTPDASVFRATIDMAEPRLLQVEARGPMAQPQAQVRVTSQQWIIPGRGMTTGDGWLLELPGLVVDAIDPPAQTVLAKDAKVQPIGVNVALMCGCPITPGGLWDAARFDVRASVSRAGAAPVDVPLSYGGRTGYFAGNLPLSGAGPYLVTVSAVDGKTGATGVDRTSFILP